MQNITVRAVHARDFLPISILLGTTFEGPSEGRLVQELRTQAALELELVAVDGETIVGHISFPRLEAPEGWVALAPVSVRWDLRERGIGSRLIQEGLDLLRQRHVPAIVVLGDPSFYRRFGFSLEAAENLKSVYPSSNLMVYPLAEGVSGSRQEVLYPRAFRYG